MKSKLYYLLALVLIASCSSPKYTYNFDHYKLGKKANTQVAQVVTEIPTPPEPIQPDALMASTDTKVVLPVTPAEESVKAEVRKTYAQMNKSERKEFRKEVKNYIKAKKETIKAAQKSNAMDNDLKLAAIFGAVGLVALIISGDVFYILGGIALIIGVVFFVKWLVRQ